jgi:hypothetical protein
MGCLRAKTGLTKSAGLDLVHHTASIFHQGDCETRVYEIGVPSQVFSIRTNFGASSNVK